MRQAFGLSAPAVEFARDASAFKNSGAKLLVYFIVGLFLLVILGTLMRACASDDCQSYKDSFGPDSSEYRQCRARSSGSGLYIPSGGSYGGYSSGGGSHK